MDMKLELVLIPVTDIDRSKAFYEQVGFDCDTDHRAGDFRVVQVTPPGSACSVGFGTGITSAEPGSLSATPIRLVPSTSSRNRTGPSVRSAVRSRMIRSVTS